MYEWREHTAELELHIEEDTPELVFISAMSAFAELAGAQAGPLETRELEVEARDRPALLVAWLEELLFLADVEGFVPERAEIVEMNTNTVKARVQGRVGTPRPLVKAVTYHGLEFREHGGRWRARVVLDV